MQYFRSLLAASGLGGGGHIIEGSGVFDGSTGYLSKVFSTPTSADTFTVEWVGKRSGLGAVQYLFGGVTNGKGAVYFDASDQLNMYNENAGGTRATQRITSAVFLDPAADLHIICQFDSTQATAADRGRMWVNGTEITSFGTTLNLNQNEDGTFNTATTHYISRQHTAASYFDGYMARVSFYDGQAYSPTDFGEVTTDGYWQINDVSGLTFGTNGFLLEGGTDMAAGTDSSGNGNNFTKTGTITATNDSPTDDADNGVGNYCTWNPLDALAVPQLTLSKGNLNTSGSVAGTYRGANGSFHLSTGKWYFEHTMTDVGNHYIGWVTDDYVYSSSWAIINDANGWAVEDGGGWYNNQTLGGSGTAFSNTDLAMFALDLDAGKMWFGRNGTWYASGDPAAGTNSQYSTGISGKTLVPAVAYAAIGSEGDTNFGQSAFTYTPPTGFKALCTANLPAPAIPDPSEHHQVELVAHDGTSTAFTCNWDADVYDTLFIIKNRDTIEKWYWVDGLNGYNKYMSSDQLTAQTTDTNVVTVSGTTITLGSTLLNDNYVVECHKAGLAGGAANTAGALSSTVSVNATSGFSITNYTGTLSATGTATVGHGLGLTAEMVVHFNLTSPGTRHAVQHKSLTGDSYVMRLDQNSAEQNMSGNGSMTAMNSTTFDTNFSDGLNLSGKNFVAYVWAGVEGYSAFGSYTASAGLPFLNHNLLPASLMAKRYSLTGQWCKYDTQRNPTNGPVTSQLYLDSTAVETIDQNRIDFVANGIKIRSAFASLDPNVSGNYLYAMWGGTPIQGNGTDASQGRAR